MNGNNYDENNPFEETSYDFYDEIIASDAKTDFSRFFLGLFIFNAVSYAASFLITLLISLVLGPEKSEALASNIYFIMIMGVLPMYCIALPALILFVRKMPRRTPERQKFGIRSFIPLFPVAIFLMSLGNYIGIFLNTVIGAIRGTPVENTTVEIVSSSPTWLTVIMVVILAPLVEEFIFRRLMIDKLSRYGYLFAILVSSLAFGLFHGNLYQFFYATLVGILLGYIYVKSGNWLLSALMHAIINLYGSVVATKIADLLSKAAVLLEQYEAGTLTDTSALSYYITVTNLYSYFHIAMLIAGAVILFKMARRREPIIVDRAKATIPKGKRAKAVFLNTGAILFIISSILIFIIQL